VNREAFEKSAIASLHPLYRYALTLTRSSDDADDLVQEAFKRSLASWRSVPSPEAIRPMLFRILRNYYVDEWRKKMRRPMMVPLDEVSEPTSPPFREKDAHAVREAFSDEVLAAMDELSGVLREVIWLREIEDLSYEEISSVINAPIGTVRSRLARARRQMAESLESYTHQRGMSRRKPGTGRSGTE